MEGNKNEYNLVFVFKRAFSLMKNSDMESNSIGKQQKRPRKRRVKIPKESHKNTIYSV